MTAVEASTVRCSTLVDGTLRLVLDIEPGDAQAAFRLFGTPGRSVAVTALKDGRGALSAPPAPEAPPPARKPRQRAPEAIAQAAERWHAKGPLERASIELCQVQAFQEFLEVNDSKEAADLIKGLCGIESRKVLDTDPVAGQVFKSRVLDPFRQSREGKDEVQIDWHRVPDDQIAMHLRLENWARYVHARHGRTSAPMWRFTRSALRTGPGSEPEARPATDPRDGDAMEQEVARLPAYHRSALRWNYVHKGPPARIARELDVSYETLAQLIHDARALLMNHAYELSQGVNC